MTHIITKCFYESRQGRDPIARNQSSCGLILIYTKIKYVIAFTVFGTNESYVFLSLALFLGSAIVFLTYIGRRPFYSDKAQTVQNLFNGLFLWTNAVLIFSCILYNLDYTASLAVYLLGIPFVIIIILNIKDHRKAFLMKEVQKLQKGEDFQTYITYYLHIIDTRDQSRDAAMTLKGYVNHHSEFCTLEDCPLRNFKKQQQKDHKKNYGQFGGSQNITVFNAIQTKNQVTNLESHPLLMSHTKNLYQNGIKKFPQCVALKIDFAHFLLQKMHNRKDALKELMNAEKCRPSLEQQFQIFRYRQLIEDELHEGADSAGGLDYVAALNFENHFSQFRSFVEKSALLHYEFWNHLMDENPDLAKLSEQGARINSSIMHVEDQWRKLTQQSTQTPKALRLYASYLIEILNDKELGNEQLQRAKEAAVVRAALNFDIGNMHEDTSDMSTFAADGSPCIYISGEQDRLGVITQCNMSACRVWGYSKKESLVGKEVEILMPKVYARQHKKFLEAAIQKPPDLLSQKERQVFGKHSSGFIFPLWLSVKNLPSFLSGRQFVGTFKIEKSGINKNVAHLILDKNKEVIDISSTCISLLDLDLNKFQKMKAKFNISLLLPTLFGPNQYQFQNKGGFQIEYHLPQLVEIQKANGTSDNIPREEGGDEDGDNDQNQSRMNPFDVSIMDDEDDGLLSNFDGLGAMNNRPEPSVNISNYAAVAKRNNLMAQVERIEEADQEDEDDEEGGDLDSAHREKLANYEYEIVPSTEKIKLQCNIVDIHFETQNLDLNNPGQYVRLEALPDKKEAGPKIQKNIKQTVFQFSYDPIYRRFFRELRDKDNKDFILDKNYLQLKKFKDTYMAQIKQGQTSTLPAKIQNMSYLSYLNRYQKWSERGSVGNMLEDQSDAGSSHYSGDEKDEDSPRAQIAQNKKQSNAPTPNNDQLTAPGYGNYGTPMGGLGGSGFIDLKKFLPAGDGSQKDHLKQEIDRMIVLLRKKQECGNGVHVYRRVEPGQKPQGNMNHPGMYQEGRYQEVHSSVASLFAGRASADRGMQSIDEDPEALLEEAEEKSSKSAVDSLKSQIKSRKAFQMAINDKSVPPAIQRLSRIATLLLLCLIAIATVEYSIVYALLKMTQTNFNVINNSLLRVAEIQKVCFNVRTMIMLNKGMLTNYQGYDDSNDLVTSIQSDLHDSLNELYTINNDINLAQLDVSADHNNLLSGDNSVTLYFMQQLGGMQAMQFSLNEATLQISSSIFTVTNLNLTQYDDTQDQDVFFLMYNSFNDFLSKMLVSCNMYVSELSDRSSAKLEISLILMILSIVTFLALVAILVPVVSSVNKQKDKVLSLFCDIEDTNVRILSQRCEKFILKIQTQEDNNDDGMESNDELNEHLAQRDWQTSADEEGPEYKAILDGQGKKKKNAKNNTRTKKFFYVKFIFGILLFEAYYLANYGMMINYSNYTVNQLNELNMTSHMEPFFWFALNTQREMLYNYSKPILNQQSLYESQQNLYDMYDNVNTLQQQHLQNQGYLTSDYLGEYNAVMYGDICTELKDELGEFQNLTTCSNFTSGVPQQGLSLVLMNFINTMQTQLSVSQNYGAGTSYSQSPQNYSQIVSLLNSEDMYNLCKYSIFILQI